MHCGAGGTLWLAFRVPRHPIRASRQVVTGLISNLRPHIALTHSDTTPPPLPAELDGLRAGLDAIDRRAEAVVRGLSADLAVRAPRAGAWSVSECFDHLAAGHTLYLEAMEDAARKGREAGRSRRGPARPGPIGRAFIWTMEPSTGGRIPIKSPSVMRPEAKPLDDTFARFMATQERARAFLRENADLDLSRIRFRNPFARGVRFSLATGLGVIAAHGRRHVAQAWRARAAVDPGFAAETTGEAG